MDKDQEINFLLNKIKKGKTQQAKLSASESTDKKEDATTDLTPVNKNIFNTNTQQKIVSDAIKFEVPAALALNTNQKPFPFPINLTNKNVSNPSSLFIPIPPPPPPPVNNSKETKGDIQVRAPPNLNISKPKGVPLFPSSSNKDMNVKLS